jgi:hypothetical protein
MYVRLHSSGALSRITAPVAHRRGVVGAGTGKRVPWVASDYSRTPGYQVATGFATFTTFSRNQPPEEVHRVKRGFRVSTLRAWSKPVTFLEMWSHVRDTASRSPEAKGPEILSTPPPMWVCRFSSGPSGEWLTCGLLNGTFAPARAAESGLHGLV